MYCSQCGTQRQPNSTYCTECGATQAPAFRPQTYPQTPSHGTPTQHPYRRMGGMLKCIQVLRVLGIISIVLIILLAGFFALGVWALSQPDVVDELGLYGDALTLEAIYTYAVLFVTVIVAGITSLVAMGQLLKRKPNFLRTTEIALLMTTAGLLLFDFILLFTQGFAAFMPQLIATIFAVAASALPLLYYTRSVRVRTYMGSDAYIKQSIFLKQVTPPSPAVPDDNSTQSF